jgi:hypothetical protein
MKDGYLTEEVSVKVNIFVAQDFLSTDRALIDLLEGDGDTNNSRYTKKEFEREIRDGNVVVAMLRDDPIGYAVVKDGKVIEHYISWMFKESDLEKIFLERVSELVDKQE